MVSAQAATGANTTFTLQPIPASLAKAGMAKGGNSIGLPQINYQCEFTIYLMNPVLCQLLILGWTTLVDWEGEMNGDAVRAAPIATTEKWRELAEERGLYLDFLYMKDASRDQNPIAGYGATNIAKLKAASQKYDPGQVFQTLQNDGFLLSKV